MGKIVVTFILLTIFTPAYASQHSDSNTTITIAFGGDVHGEYPISKQIANKKSVLGDAKEIFKSADLAVINLETAITDHTQKRKKQYNFKSRIELLHNLKKSGVDVVSIANNHSFDYGLKGFKDTLESIAKSEMDFVGGGLNEERAYSYKSYAIKGIKVGILGLAMVNGGSGSIAINDKAGTTNGWDDKKSIRAIKKAKRSNDIVIVLPHWGAELASCPRESEVSRASAWLKAGATAVVGSHPHVLQAVVQDENTLVAFSLGNLAFYAKKAEARKSGVLLITFDKSGVVANDLVPYEIDPAKGVLTTIDKKAEIKRKLELERISDPKNCKNIEKLLTY